VSERKRKRRKDGVRWKKSLCVREKRWNEGERRRDESRGRERGRERGRRRDGERVSE
jgi:hypothetical protein